MAVFGILWKAVFGRPFKIDKKLFPEVFADVSSFLVSVRLLLMQDVDNEALQYLKDFFLLVFTTLVNSDFDRYVPPVPALATLFCLLQKEKGKFPLLDGLLAKLEGDLSGVSVNCLGHFVRKTFSHKSFPKVLLRMAWDEALLRKTDSFLSQYDFQNQKVRLSESSSVQDKTKRNMKRKEQEEEEPNKTKRIHIEKKE
jgi:hypothetical protein